MVQSRGVQSVMEAMYQTSPLRRASVRYSPTSPSSATVSSKTVGTLAMKSEHFLDIADVYILL